MSDPAMNASVRTERIAQLFTETRKLPTDQRRAFLESACSGQPELIPEVESLLQFDTSARCTLDRPALAIHVGEALHAVAHCPLTIPVRCGRCRETTDVPADTSATALECRSCGSRFSLTQSDETGTGTRELPNVGHFRLQRRVGIGAFSTVWQAHDAQLDRTVAIKLSRNRLLCDTDLERILREARAAAQLRHPGIVQVYEVGREGDFVYIASDFISGTSLAERLESGRPTCHESASLCRQIAESLAHAHERGVVHRDVKPANVLINGTGHPVLTDFGLARRESVDLTMTNEGQLVGTLAYMSPEQALGKGHQSDCRSDIYSLGVVLYQLLTGEVPFRGTSAMVVDQVVRHIPPSPRKINQHVPPELETITLKCLEKEPERRYQSATELADDLRRYLRGEAITARPIGAAGRTWRWCRRNKVVAATSVGLACALIIGIAATSTQWIRADRHAAAESSVNDQLQRSLYVLRMDKNHQYWQEANVEKIQHSLEAYPPNENGDPRQRFEWEYWWRRSQLYVESFDHGAAIRALAISPDDTLLATGGTDGSIKIWSLTMARLVNSFRTHSGDAVTTVSFLPDGQSLAFATANGHLSLCSLNSATSNPFPGHPYQVTDFRLAANGSVIIAACADDCLRSWKVDGLDAPVVIPIGKSIQSFDVSPDTEQIVLGLAEDAESAAATVEIWSLADRAPEKALCNHPRGVRGLAFSPDGRQIACMGEESFSLRLWDTASGEVVNTFGEWITGKQSLVFSREGENLALAAPRRNEVLVFDVRSGKVINTLRGHGASVGIVRFSNRGDFVVSAGDDGRAVVWDASADLSDAFVFPNRGTILDAVLSPDGHLLATVHERDGAARLWDPSTSELLYVLATPPEQSRHVVVSPDGRLLATAGNSDRINLWDPATGTLLSSFNGNADVVLDLVFAPDSSILATLGSDGKIRLWNCTTRQLQAVLPGPRVNRPEGVSLACFSDGALLAAAYESECRLIVWDVVSRMASDINVDGRPITGIALSPAGQLAIGDRDGRLQIADPHSNSPPLQLEGHTGRIGHLLYAPDGGTLISGSDDGAIRYWDPTSGELIYMSNDHHETTALAVSPDGTAIVTTRGDNGPIVMRRGWPETLYGNPQGLLQHRAEEALSQSRWYEAKALYSRLIDKYASISAYHIGRGIAGAQRHEWSDALNDFDRAIHDTPNDARAYCHRGQLLAALQRWREAADDFERARTLADPSNNRLPTTPWWVSGIVSHKTARNLANSFPSQTPGAPPLLPKVDGIEWDVRLPSADGVLYVPCDGRPPGTREWSAVSHHRSVLRDVCQCDEDQTIVMACYVYSIGDQDCVFHFSADPKCTVSVNGRDVHNWRGDLFDREVLPVKLHAGWNSVVVAISIQNGRPGIYLRAVSKQSVPPEG